MKIKILLLWNILTNTNFKLGAADIHEKIVGGEYANIENVPHSVFLSVACEYDGSVTSHACGASILNQKILLTAAHCFEDCSHRSKVLANVGNSHKMEGDSYLVSDFKIHEYYNKIYITNDVAVAKVDVPIKFGSTVKRIIIMRRPPYFEPALVAGWGVINDYNKITSTYLKQLKQTVLPRQRCMDYLPRIPEGTICTGMYGQEEFASNGDSGGALTVRGYIQIGLVSYRNLVIKGIVVYTDVGYFYDWISRASKAMYCKN